MSLMRNMSLIGYGICLIVVFKLRFGPVFGWPSLDLAFLCNKDVLSAVRISIGTFLYFSWFNRNLKVD